MSQYKNMEAPIMSTPLCEIMGRHRSDKGSVNIETSWHNYTTYYYKLFAPRREEKLRIFELGLGTNNLSVPSNMGINGRPGASLYGWEEFFPHAQVFGADIDTGVLFDSGRIRTFFCDQRSPKIISDMWRHPDLSENMDIVVEDGLHEFEANVCFFENSQHKVRVNGYYVIEDILTKDFPRYREVIERWKVQYPEFTYELVQIPSLVNKVDNNLLVAWKKS